MVIETSLKVVAKTVNGTYHEIVDYGPHLEGGLLVKTMCEREYRTFDNLRYEGDKRYGRPVFVTCMYCLRKRHEINGNLKDA